MFAVRTAAGSMSKKSEGEEHQNKKSVLKVIKRAFRRKSETIEEEGNYDQLLRIARLSFMREENSCSEVILSIISFNMASELGG